MRDGYVRRHDRTHSAHVYGVAQGSRAANPSHCSRHEENVAASLMAVTRGGCWPGAGLTCRSVAGVRLGRPMSVPKLLPACGWRQC
jgi:hypothetical protein